jgi:hypothetical protein
MVQAKVVYVCYRDHVLFSHCSPLVVQPQVRETVGWLVYETDGYITISWDRDHSPPSLKGGDAKATGLVIMRTDILELKKIG